jgi:K+-transporting ATPase ATPase C chain
MMKLILKSTGYVVVLSILLGGAYPAFVALAARLFWKDRAGGSFVTANGRIVGSSLIGQSFAGDRYLHPRPSAAGKDGYDGTASGGTNLGPTSADLARRVSASVAAARADRPGDPRPVPADFVTASASGLDPHLSPEAAEWQAARIARARGVPEERVLALLRRHIEGRTLALLGDPRVNVLLTNIDLDRELPGR